MADSVQIIENLLQCTDDEQKTTSVYANIRSSTLSNNKLCRELTEASIDWATSNGLTMGSPTMDNAYIHAPFTLLPIIQNLNEFNELSSISLIFHKLIDAISRDSKFLISCIQSTAESDADFTGKMLDLYKKQIEQNKWNQKYQLGIFRSDYMKNAATNKWGQIEMNTISSSFGALSDSVYELHRFLLSRYLNLANIKTPPSNTSENIASALGISSTSCFATPSSLKKFH